MSESMDANIFNYLCVCIGIVGTLCNIVWISIYLQAYKIHTNSVNYPQAIEILLTIQAISDGIMSATLTIFNILFIADSKYTYNARFWLYLVSLSLNASYTVSACMIAVVGRLCYCFLQYTTSPTSTNATKRIHIHPHDSHSPDKTQTTHDTNSIYTNINKINSLAVVPTIATMIFAAIGAAFILLYGEIEIKPSKAYAYAEFDSGQGIIVSVWTSITVVIYSVPIFYYYFSIIKLSQRIKSFNIEHKTCSKFKWSCCSFKLNRLSRIAIAIVSTFLSSSVISQIIHYIGFGTNKVTPLKDFLTILPIFLYSSFCNGLAICYSSRIYQLILKNMIFCRRTNSTLSVNTSTKPPNESFQQEDSYTLHSKAMLEMSCA